MVKAFDIPQKFLNSIRDDLQREIPHGVDALERVGFLFAKINSAGVFTPSFYMPIDDSQYLERPRDVGARYSGDAIDKAIDRVILNGEVFFTIHIHDERGEPTPSRTDLLTERALVGCFLKISNMPHGAIILSDDSLLVRCWDETTETIRKVTTITILPTEEK